MPTASLMAGCGRDLRRGAIGLKIWPGRVGHGDCVLYKVCVLRKQVELYTGPWDGTACLGCAWVVDTKSVTCDIT